MMGSAYWLRTALSAAALVWGAGGAHAGDAAAARVLGFSPDGAYFAFEEFGTFDTPASPNGYAHVFVIDTEHDAFLPGMPITVEDRREQSTLTVAQAWKQAKTKAAPILQRLGITAAPPIAAIEATRFGETVSYKDIPDLFEKAPKRLAIPSGLPGGPAEILLETMPLAAAGCALASADGASQDGKSLGFRLTVRRANGQVRMLHEDAKLPKSRECPSAYGIAAAYLAPRRDKPPILAVLLQRFSPGWEGQDRRFLAVTSALEP
jgi:predicted secreted protein